MKGVYLCVVLKNVFERIMYSGVDVEIFGTDSF